MELLADPWKRQSRMRFTNACLVALEWMGLITFIHSIYSVIVSCEVEWVDLYQWRRVRIGLSCVF